MSIESEARALVIAGSRGEDTRAANIDFQHRYANAPAVLKAASERQDSLIISLRLAASQSGLLVAQIDALSSMASALKSNLGAAKITAAVDLDNSTAGDSAVAALAALLTALSTARSAAQQIPSLTYQRYRDA